MQHQSGFRHFDPRQIILFLAVGGFSTAFNYGVFWIFLRLGLFYLAASWAGYLAGVVAGYFLNARYTFQSRSSRRLLIFYIFVYAVSLVLSTLTLSFLVQIMRLRPEFGNILAIIQSTLTNYLGCKYFVFKRGAIA